MARAHYSDAQRADALAVLDGNKGNVARTARDTGLPRGTLREWAADRDRAAPAELRHQKKEALADLLEASVRATVAAITPEKLAATPADKLGVLIGILTDKMHLVRNQATAPGKDPATSRSVCASLFAPRAERSSPGGDGAPPALRALAGG